MITVNNRDILDKLVILLLLIIIIFHTNKEIANPTNIPELFYYENQTLQMLVPKKECKYIAPMTIYFRSEFSDFNNSDNYEIRKIKNKIESNKTQT